MAVKAAVKREELYLIRSMPIAENGYWLHLEMALETRKKTFARADVVLKVQSSIGERGLSLAAAGVVVSGVDSTTPNSSQASQLDFPYPLRAHARLR
jgi:hypothetical protein